MTKTKPTLTLEGARTNLHMSQSEMADALGFSINNYREYEKYRRVLRLDKAYKFAETVNQPIDAIIFLPEDYESFVASSKEKQGV